MFKKLLLIVLIANIGNINAMEESISKDTNSIQMTNNVYTEANFRNNIWPQIIEKYKKVKFISKEINKQLYKDYNNIIMDVQDNIILSKINKLTCYEMIIIYLLQYKLMNEFAENSHGENFRELIQFGTVPISNNLKKILNVLPSAYIGKYAFCIGGGNCLIITEKKQMDFTFGPIIRNTADYDTLIEELFHINKYHNTLDTALPDLLSNKKLKVINDSVLDSNNNKLHILIDKIYSSLLHTVMEKQSLLQLLYEFYEQQYIAVSNYKPLFVNENWNINLYKASIETFANEELRQQLYTAYDKIKTIINEKINDMKMYQTQI